MSALVIDGHPNPESLSAEIARRYAAGFGDARLIALRDLDFDVHLRSGYSRSQPLEPDLVDAWEAMERADHIVVVTPIWWGATPALLSGFFDRILLPRRAFRFSRLGLPIGLLAGRSGRLIVTTDSPRLFLALRGDPTVRSVREGTMEYCGIRPTRVTRIGPVRSSDAAVRAGWLDGIERLARRDAHRRRRPWARHGAAQAAARRMGEGASSSARSGVRQTETLVP